MTQIIVVFPGNEQGGAATHIVAYARAVVHHGHESSIRFVSLGHGPLYEELQKTLLQVTAITGSTVARIQKLQSMMRHQPGNTLWHSHGPRANLLVYLATRMSRCKFTSTIHSDPYKDFLGSRAKTALFTRMNLHSLRKTVGVFVGNRLFAEKIPVHAYYVPNAIEPVHTMADKQVAHRELCARLGIPGDSQLLGVVARLDPVKDLGTVITALSILKSRVKQPVHLVIAGHGSDLGRLTRIAVEHEVSEAVHFLGFVKDIGPLYRALDVHVLASKSEGESPFGILESGAYGVPNIGSDIAGIRNLITDGETGLIFPTGDAAVLAARIAQVLDEPELAEGLVRQFAKRVLPRFSPAAMLNGYLTGYKAMGFAIPQSESQAESADSALNATRFPDE